MSSINNKSLGNLPWDPGSRFIRICYQQQAIPLQIVNRNLRTATWNVRSIYSAGILGNVEQEMKGRKIHVLSLSEIRWLGAAAMKTDSGVMYFFGAILVNKDIAESIFDFVPLNDIEYRYSE